MDLKAFRDLKTLHNQGVLSEAEYTAAKLKLLDVTAQQVVEGGAVVAAARGVAASPVVAPAPLENEASPVVTPHEGEASAPAPLEDEAPSDDERAAIDLLFDAIERGDEKAVVRCLYELDPAEQDYLRWENLDGERPLDVACRIGESNVVILILACGADAILSVTATYAIHPFLRLKDSWPQETALKHGHTFLAELFEKQNFLRLIAVPFSLRRAYLLQRLYGCEGIEAINILLEHGFADVDELDWDGGSTILHIACGFADLEAVALLLDRGAGMEVRSDEGTSPLDQLLAGFGRRDEVFRTVPAWRLERRQNFDDDVTRVSILRLLIDRGVDLLSTKYWKSRGEPLGCCFRDRRRSFWLRRVLFHVVGTRAARRVEITTGTMRDRVETAANTGCGTASKPRPGWMRNRVGTDARSRQPQAANPGSPRRFLGRDLVSVVAGFLYCDA